MRQDADKLLIPIYDGETLISLQQIAGDGDKRFTAASRVEGGSYALGEVTPTIWIGEGFATCATIHERTGNHTVVAFNSKNLLPVARKVWAAHPKATIIVAADDDYDTSLKPGPCFGINPGVRDARAAAGVVGARVAVPPFNRQQDDRGSDWNDLQRIVGKDEIARLLKAAEACAASIAGPVVLADGHGDFEASAANAYLATEQIRVADGAPAAPAVSLLRGSGIRPKPINWLWYQWLAAGKLHLLGGQPGSGKTTIAISMAAAVTRGGIFPDGSRCPVAGNVIIWSGEDDFQDTLAPRLIAAGADMEKIFFVSGVHEDGKSRDFDPAKDVVLLQAAIKNAGGAALVIVDPVVSAIAGDSHKNSETRRALQPLVALCADIDAALLGITHFTKGTAGARADRANQRLDCLRRARPHRAHRRKKGRGRRRGRGRCWAAAALPGSCKIEHRS